MSETTQTQPIDITKIPTEQLWKLAFEQQQLISTCMAQISQAQTNIVAIQTEISKREEKPL